MSNKNNSSVTFYYERREDEWHLYDNGHPEVFRSLYAMESYIASKAQQYELVLVTSENWQELYDQDAFAPDPAFFDDDEDEEEWCSAG